MEPIQFPYGATRHLAQRAGLLCSNPQCRKRTLSPTEHPRKGSVFGIAVPLSTTHNGSPHATAWHDAVSTGADNGIWLCAGCAALAEQQQLPAQLLQEWKKTAEEATLQQMRSTVRAGGEEQPVIDADLFCLHVTRFNRGFSLRNKTGPFHWQGATYFNTREPIIRWKLYWQFHFVLYNNSHEPAFQLSVTQPGPARFSFLETPGKTAQLEPLQHLALKAEQFVFFEGTSADADKQLQCTTPQGLEGLKLKTQWRDSRKRLYTCTTILSAGIIVPEMKI
jgi:hypothetical protein